MRRTAPMARSDGAGSSTRSARAQLLGSDRQPRLEWECAQATRVDTGATGLFCHGGGIPRALDNVVTPAVTEYLLVRDSSCLAQPRTPGTSATPTISRAAACRITARRPSVL